MFNPNLVLVNYKLKPYNLIKNKTLQLVLANPSELVLMNLFK
jgi:hypothetical protein